MKINICLNDGLPNISFNISGIDEERFCKFIDECNQAWRENEIIKKQLDRLHDRIMNISTDTVSAADLNVSVRYALHNTIVMSQKNLGRETLLIAYKFGHRDARHAAAELVLGIKAGKEAE